ncbi:MAG TPA: MBL fold metallo-hydrolase [Bacteroidales bacterium]|nr:MBL fold metallo-hydrolase [Bacteroidales bacterium]
MEIYSIPTGNFKLDGGAMFGVVPKSLWSKVYPADENNLCSWAMRCLLVVMDNRKILIDNGIGDKQDAKFLGNYHLHGDDSLEKSLAKYGFAPDDITDMVLTHLHFDHTGGSIKWNANKTALIPAFKNAKYWVSKAQWEWATRPNNREKASFLKENIMPMQESGQLNILENEGEIYPDFNLKIVNGHTNGQMIPHIKYKGKTIVYMGDLLPSTAHIPLPWIMAYDTRPLLTLDEKKLFFEEAVANNYTLFFEHDLYSECCNLIQTEKGIRLNKAFSLEEWKSSF